MKFFLLGFMGTGKTHWGNLWARQYMLPFFDLDSEIERHMGMTIAAIFEEHGEFFFRQKERSMLQSFDQKDRFILSCGGGTPCFFDNMKWMNDHGITIYINTPPAVLKERLLKEKNHRPLIQALNDEELDSFIHMKLSEREKFYLQARIILESEKISDITFTQIVQQYV